VVGKATLRGLIHATALGSLLAVAGPASAQDLCAAITIPAPIGLACTPSSTPGEVAVAPVSGTFALLSRMGLRPLERAGADALAWTDPAGWLRAQVTPDTAALTEPLEGAVDDPDSPFTGPRGSEALDTIRRALAGVSALALSACEDPAPIAPEAWQMRCRYTTDGLGLSMVLRLVADGEQRWAITMRAANEQRLRHFEAIANSFQPS
jgi:hypothetical protein